MLRLEQNAHHFWSLLVSLALITTAGGNLPMEDAVHRGAALSPDDTLFAHLRCFERYANKQGHDRERDAAGWLGTGQNYLLETDRTVSFVKCIVTKLRLYDPEEQTFNSTILKQQFQTFGKWMSLDEESVQLFVNETQGVTLQNGSPEAVHNAFEQLFANHSNTYFQLFLREPNVLQNMHNQKEFPFRKPNQTVIEYCEHRMGERLWNEICHIRTYEISNQTEAMEAHLSCIFKGFHYLNQDGFINAPEIVEDFAKANVLNNQSETNIKECSEDSQREQAFGKRSLRMYTCLLDGSSKELFKEAFDFREIRSGNLSYLLQNLPYDREQVKRQIVALDRERCDDQQRPTGRMVHH